MMPVARVVAIDDERAHLDGITKGLNSLGVGCLQIHFQSIDLEIVPCPQARVIFADLHLTSGGAGTDNKKHFGIIAGLLEESLKPLGLYILILWTAYPDQAEGLRDYLAESLSVSKRPFAVVPLDKKDHLDGSGNVKDVKALVRALESIVEKKPQLAVLLNWEDRVLGAAAETVSSIIDVALGSAKTSEGKSEEPEVALARILAHIALETAGRNNAINPSTRFSAVNEGLLPILADRVAHLEDREADKVLWEAAFAEKAINDRLTSEQNASLNRLLHIDPHASSGVQRGAVLPLPARFADNFPATIGLSLDDVKNEFRIKIADGVRWILVQTQAACDAVQAQKGLSPFYLGVEVHIDQASKTEQEALWRSPIFMEGGVTKRIHVNARYQLSLPSSEVADLAPYYRLRDQALSELIYKVHTYAARPGLYYF